MPKTDPVCGKSLGETGERNEPFCSAACRKKFANDPTRKLTDYTYDLIIVGGGPAGLSAGIYAALNQLHSLFLTRSMGGQAWDSTEILNYPGFEFISGPDLVERFRRQLLDSLHLAHQICGVTSIRKDADIFCIHTDGAEEYRSRTVVFATGMRRRRLGIPGEAELRGRGVGEFHALAAPRFQGKEAVVIGGGNSACHAALGLAKAGSRVVLACRGYTADAYLKEQIDANETISVYQNRVPVRIEGADRAEVVVVRNQDTYGEEVIPCEAVFVEVGLVPSSDLVKNLVHLNPPGEIVVDSNCATGLPGLFAAGDVTNIHGKRILIAAGEGAKAVLAAQAFLNGR